MRQLMLKKAAKIFLHFALFAVLFLLLVALFDNKNTMNLKIYTTSGQSADPAFYYTKQGSAFSDSKMSRGRKTTDNNYLFNLPELDDIVFARLDPIQYRDEVHIAKNIQITVSKWFTNHYYQADITQSEPGGQITHFKADKNGIHFEATGNDPFININLTRKLIHTTHDLHIDTLLFAFLTYLLLVYLYQVYKTETMNNFLTAKLIIYGFFITFALFKVNYYKDHVHYTYPPDTIAHLSYIDSIHKHTELFPKFENMYMFNNPNAGNYLGHPPLYYMLMNTVYDPSKPFKENLDRFRTLNIILFFAAVLLLFYLGFQAPVGILGHFAYVSVVTSLPMHAYLGSSITNDNLAILGGLIFLIGLYKLLQGKYTNSSYLIIGVGIFIAYFSKLTAALLVFFAAIFFFIYVFTQKISFKINKVQITLLALFILPALIYQLYIFMHYHTLVPTLNATHPEEYKHSVYYIPEAKRVYMSLTQWMENYWNNIHLGWFGIHSHHSFAKSSIMEYIGLFILHLFAIFALFFKCDEKRKSYCVLGKLSLLAFFSVMLVQVGFSYSSHLHSGYTGGLQVRYLLPFMVAFAIMASVFVNRFRHMFLFSVFTIFLCIQAIYSDFFYFLTYYL